jgi:hypothetical protein
MNHPANIVAGSARCWARAVGGNTGTAPNPAMNSRRRIRHALKLLCGQPMAVGVVWERGRAFISLRPALPPVRPSIRAHNAAGARHARAEPGKGMWSGRDRRSAPLRSGRSVGRGSARPNRCEHDLLRLVRRAVRRIRAASWSNEGKWSNGTFSGCGCSASRKPARWNICFVTGVQP